MHPLQIKARAKGLLIEWGRGNAPNYFYEVATKKLLPCPDSHAEIEAAIEAYEPKVKA